MKRRRKKKIVKHKSIIIVIAHISGTELWTSALANVPGTCGSGNVVTSATGCNMAPWGYWQFNWDWWRNVLWRICISDPFLGLFRDCSTSEKFWQWNMESCKNITTLRYKVHLVWCIGFFMGILWVRIFYTVPVLADTVLIPVFVWCLTKPTVSHIPTVY